MKVLTFLHSFEPGGVERVALRLVAAWRRAGVDAPLFMGRDGGALRNEVSAGLAFRVPARPRFGSSRWETLWMMARLPGEIRRSRPDVLFCAGSTYTVVAVAMKLLLGRRCPPIVAKISNDLLRSDLPWFARTCWRGWLRLQARLIDRWVTMYATLLADVRLTMGPVACSVVPDPAIDQAQVCSASPRVDVSTGRRFFAVGRLAAQKNFDLLLLAFRRGAREDDTLTIFGDGPLRGPLERRAAALGLRSRVRFAGHVPNASSRFRAGDVLVMSSDYEGIPAVLVEALACGLSIVATDAGHGVRALLRDGRFGTIVPRGRADLLAAAIHDADPEAVDRAGAQAHAAGFTIDRGASLYLAAFRDALDGAASAMAVKGLSLAEDQPRGFAM